MHVSREAPGQRRYRPLGISMLTASTQRRLMSSRPSIPQVDRILSQQAVESSSKSSPSRPATAGGQVVKSASSPGHGRSSSGSTPALLGVPNGKLAAIPRPLDVLASLNKNTPTVVKTRQGSVLSRGFILKTDYYPSGVSLSAHDLNHLGLNVLSQ